MKTIKNLLILSLLFVYFPLNISAQDNEKKVTVPKLDLHAAIYMKDFKTIKRHIEAGSDLNVPDPTFGSSPLISATFLDVAEAVKLLIDAGADLNSKNKEGSTALHTAAAFGKTEIANMLMDAGADLNVQNNEGSTPLHTSAFFCHTDIVKILLKKGADKSIKNKYNQTPYETVSMPYEKLEEVYEAIGKGLKPLGIKLDFEHIEKTRPIIAEILKD